MTTRIGAYRSSSYVEFRPLPELSSASFDVVASVEGRTVHNNSLSLFEPAEFLRQLELLQSTWTGVATLTGTYEFRLEVRAIRVSELSVSVYITDYISASSDPPTRHILDASFRLPDNAAQRLFDQFHDLLSAPQNA